MIIKLFCAGGMSTSILMKKMREAAEKRGLEVQVTAHPEGRLERESSHCDVALLGPQVGFQIEKAKKICDPINLPIGIIPMRDYGMMDGDKVLDFALDLIK